MMIRTKIFTAVLSVAFFYVPISFSSVDTPAAKGQSLLKIALPSEWGKKISFTSENRNPMLSPEEAAAEAVRRRREEERLAALNRKSGPAKPRVTTLESVVRSIQLQAIIGDQAVMNGNILRVGAVINEAVLLKVGSNYVILRYKGTMFRKVLNK